MENLKLNDEKALIEIFKIISWLDGKRWEKQQIEKPDTFSEEILKADELQPTQKILAHWLIYITDRGKRADVLWESNSPKVRKLIIEYFSRVLSKKEQVTELCKRYEEGENKIQSFPADLESIRRTLILLLEYDKDIINFMTKRVSKWKISYPENFCPRIAFSLYLLSYKDVGSFAKKNELREHNKDKLNESMEEAKKILNDDNKFEKEFQEWYKGDKRWHKRIWAALRDYKKHKLLSEVFIEGIKVKVNQDAWRENFTEQLEVPGDIWNIRFFENCIKPFAENMNVRGKNASRVVRNLWKKIKSKCPQSYPEQFDITVDFAPRMCNKKFCDICPFGRNGAEFICIPNNDKCCPVALICCGYIVECIGNKGECIIKEGIGKGMCKHELK